ncbi:MAG: hypothetical protein FWH22_10175, partial [Fibromonadales bacterium]|nr:hypothetical protein [Fibromonadales bacterium]
MFRLFLIVFLCVLFMACSSTEEPAALKQWFDDQGIATSYGKQYEEIDVSVSFDRDLNNSAYDTAYMVSSFAALGNVNSLEQSLYFGLEILDSISPVWKL